jgi:hypothetical protein
LDATTTGSFENAVLLPRPLLQVSYDEDLDFLCALVPGETLDEHLDDETQPLVVMDDETEQEIAWRYTRGPDGPLIGFGVRRAFEWPVADEPRRTRSARMPVICASSGASFRSAATNGRTWESRS